MNPAPLISVVLPCFNAEAFIGDAVASVIAQTYRNLEIIIIDDGSRDDSARIIASFDDPRIRFISRENRGLVRTLNEAIGYSSGEYIARMDADDIADPSRFRLQLEWMQAHDLALCGTAIEFIGGKKGSKYYPVDDLDLRYGMLFWGRSFPHPTVMLRRDLLERCTYEERYRHAEDAALWLKLLSVPGARFGNIPQPLLKYRVHEKQVTAIYRAEQVAVEKSMMEDALQLLDIAISEQELQLHHDFRRRVQAGSALQVEAYGRWLERLQLRLFEIWPRSRLIADKWYEYCCFNAVAIPDIYRCFAASPLSAGTGLSRRLRLRFR